MKQTFSIIFFTVATLHFSSLTGGEPLKLDDKAPCESCKWDSHRPDSHAPIGVMGDHTHETGEIMLSYRYLYMDMRPNYVGSNEVPVSSVQGPPNGTTFPIIPTNMQGQMHMVGLMYGLTDNLTLSAMLGRMDKAMDHSVRNGTVFRTHTEGIGDFKFGGLLKIYDDNCQRVQLNLMMSAPTGSIDETGFVPPAGAVIRLPYPMQLGSGTFDLNPGITYLGQHCRLSWGGQVLGTIRLGENSEDYSLGDELTVNAWLAYQLSDQVSASFRATGKSWGDVDGSDPNLNPLTVPTARPDLRGGERIDLFGGVNYLFTDGVFKGHRLAAEAGGSVYQDLDGPQLGTDWMITVGWQKAF